MCPALFRTTAAVALALSLGGCPAEPPVTPPASPSDPAASAGPGMVFLDARPEGAQPLLAVKASSKVGDEVVFEARVGGRAQPFVEGRAVFNVADPALPSCEDNADDGCATPWDYCCEDAPDLLKQVATVRFVDAAGDPLESSLEGQHGLAGLATVVVRGKVVEADESGVFVVDASGVWVGS